MNAITRAIRVLVIGLSSSVVQAVLDPLTYTSLDPVQSSALVATLTVFRSTYAQPSGSAYSAAYSILSSIRTDTSAALAVSQAEQFLATWLPRLDSPDRFGTIISGLPAPVQTYLVSIANAENSIAAGVLQSLSSKTAIRQSIDPAQATFSLFNALPASLQGVALTNPAAVATEIASEFATGTPTWFKVLPTPVQSYFISDADFTADFFPTPTSLFTVVQAVSTASSASSTGSAQSNSSSDSTGLPAGAKTGIGVAIGIGVPLIAVLLGIFILYRRKRQRAIADPPGSGQPRLRMSEMSGISAKQELAGSNLQGTTGVQEHSPQELSQENYRDVYHRSA